MLPGLWLSPNAVPQPALPPSAPRVRLTTGVGTAEQKTWNLRRPVTLIGSRPRAHIVIQNNEVSKAHCVIVNTAQNVLLRDLVSRTGTSCNGQKIDLVPLGDGDVVTVGPARVQVAVQQAEPLEDKTESGLIFEDPTKLAVPIVMQRTDAPDRWELDRSVIVIGRREGADVRLDHEDVSLAHAIIFHIAGRPVIFDLGSRTGTIINGQREVIGPLAGGDTLRFGAFELTVHLDEAKPVEPAAAGSAEQIAEATAKPAPSERQGDAAAGAPGDADPATAACAEHISSGGDAARETVPPPFDPAESSLSELEHKIATLRQDIGESCAGLNGWYQQLRSQQDALNEQAEQLAACDEKLQKRSAELAEAERNLAAQADEVDQCRQRIEADAGRLAREQEQHSNAAIELASAREQFERESAELQSLRQQAKADAEELAARRQENDKQRQELQTGLEELEAERQQLQQRLQQKLEQLEADKAGLARANEELEQQRRRVEESAAELSRRGEEFNQQRQQIEKAAAEIESQRAALGKQQRSLEEKADQLQEREKQIKLASGELARQREQVEGSQVAAREREQAADRRMGELTQYEQVLKQREAALGRLQTALSEVGSLFESASTQIPMPAPAEQPTPSPGKRPKKSAKQAADSQHAPRKAEPEAKTSQQLPGAGQAPQPDATADGDPAVREKLRMLRRLGSDKSEEELLAQLQAEQSSPNTSAGHKKKRSWWSRG